VRITVNRAVFLLLALLMVPTLVTGHELFVRTLYVLTALIALSFGWSWLNIHWLTASRALRSGRAQVGGLVQERLSIRNKGRLPKLWVGLHDRSEVPGYRADRAIGGLSGRGKRSWVVLAECKRRGKFTFGPVTLLTSDPLGLFRWERDLPLYSTLVVYPATVDLPHFKPPVGRLSGGDALQRQTQQVTTNVSGVRDYLPGDSFNRIHWLSTARRGRLISKEFELDPQADVWLFVDMQESVQSGSYADELVFKSLDGPAVAAKAFELPSYTEEYLVTIAASLAKHLLSRKRALGMISYGQRREVVQVDRGERQLVRVMESLAVLKAAGQVTFAEVIAGEASQLWGGSTAIMITSSTETAWVGAARDLKRKGIDVMAIHVEPSTFGESPSSLDVMAGLAASNITAYLVKNGQPISEAFSQVIER